MAMEWKPTFLNHSTFFSGRLYFVVWESHSATKEGNTASKSARLVAVTMLLAKENVIEGSMEVRKRRIEVVKRRNEYISTEKELPRQILFCVCLVCHIPRKEFPTTTHLARVSSPLSIQGALVVDSDTSPFAAPLPLSIRVVSLVANGQL